MSEDLQEIDFFEREFEMRVQSEPDVDSEII